MSEAFLTIGGSSAMSPPWSPVEEQSSLRPERERMLRDHSDTEPRPKDPRAKDYGVFAHRNPL